MTIRVTLITGASSGIGAEFARVFAANGHRVVLVARREEPMKALAEEIVAAGGPEPMIVPCDLSGASAGDDIAAALAGHDAEVEFLVNNAGFGLVGRAAGLDRAAQLDMIDVNVRALADLSLRFAPHIIRHRGGILNVGSVAGFMPGPGMATYYATKAFVLSFTEALHAELRSQGVRVCALCPGPVPTGFQRRAAIRPDRRTTPMDVAADRVAREGYRALIAGRRLVIPGWASLLPMWVRLMPRAWVLSATAKTLQRR